MYISLYSSFFPSDNNIVPSVLGVHETFVEARTKIVHSVLESLDRWKNSSRWRAQWHEQNPDWKTKIDNVIEKLRTGININDEHDCSIEIEAKLDGSKYTLSCNELEDGFNVIYFGDDEPSREVWKISQV